MSSTPTQPKTLEERLFKTYTVQPNPIVRGRLAIAAPEKRQVIVVPAPKPRVRKK